LNIPRGKVIEKPRAERQQARLEWSRMKPGSEPLSSGPLNRRQFVCGTAASAAALVLSGCLLALGSAFGRERLDDWAGWRACLVPARAFCDRFVAEMGSTQCADVVEKVFGHRYNLADPAELARFQDAAPTAKCGGVVREAVRLAAGLILDKRGEEPS